MNYRGILRNSPQKKKPLDPIQKRHTEILKHFKENNPDDKLKSRYIIPGLNTALRVEKRLEELKNDDKDAIKDSKTLPLQLVATEKALKKLNIVQDKQMYKRLPPINVNDSPIHSRQKQQQSGRKKKEMISIDSEPILDDYLKSSEMMRHRLELDALSDDEPESRIKIANDNFRRLHELLFTPQPPKPI